MMNSSIVSKSASWQQQIKAVNSTSSEYNPSDGIRSGGMVVGSDGSDPLVLEKICPRGLGACNFFTTNTERNHSRFFYKCPQHQIEKWAISRFGGMVVVSDGSDPLVPEKMCPCGLGAYNVFTANTERNHSHCFYKCPQHHIEKWGGVEAKAMELLILCCSLIFHVLVELGLA